jgi:tetratricopeptide (TPR) repeat protein
MMKPICFMVMPYGKRKTNSSGKELPSEIDFDALWNKAFYPVLSLQYEPVRADQDLGALIIKEMIERLVIADLVVADVTLPNANVYYEVGIRHAAKRNRCVLVAAEGSRQLFDIKQMPQLRYPLKEGTIKRETSAAIRRTLKKTLGAFVQGESPVFQSVPGYPAKVKMKEATSFREYARKMMQFQSRTRAVYVAPSAGRRKAATKLLRDYAQVAGSDAGIALELLYVVRDCVGWKETIDYIDNLPADILNHPTVQEQYCLAKSKIGDHESAIGALETLLGEYGETSERHGLLGGRYRRLFDEAKNKSEKREYLDKAIHHYQRGMEVDLNDYYPSCNLPRLYRLRNKKGDEELARRAAAVSIVACRRALVRDPQDDWLRPTLIGAAFDDGNVAEARRLVEEIRREGASKWKLGTTIETLKMSISLQKDEKVKRGLRQVLKELRNLLHG